MLEHGYLGSRTELRGMGLDLNKKRVFDRVKKNCRRAGRRDRVSMATSFTKGLGADPVAVIELEFALGEEFDMEITDAN